MVNIITAVFDTNILIDYLSGKDQAKEVLEYYKNRVISRISWMEVLVGTSSDEEERIKQFLESFTIAELTPEICEIAINIRKQHRVKLPDAVIWATAKSYRGILITRDNKDFPNYAPDIKIPYIVPS